MNPTTTRTPHLAPSEVHATLGRHMLVDGYDIVLDLDKSQGRRLWTRATSAGCSTRSRSSRRSRSASTIRR